VLAGAGGVAAVAAIGALWSFTRPDDSGGDTSGGDTSGGGSTDGGNGGEPPTTVRIAAIAPLTGANAAFGEHITSAVRLAVEEANASGDFPDFRFDFLPADEQDAVGPAALARQMVDDPRVLAVVGPALPGPARDAAEIFHDAGLAAVTPSATNPTLTQQGYGSFLSAVPNDWHVGLALGGFLAAQGPERVMVIDDAGTYSAVVVDGVAQRLREEGVEMRRESSPADAGDVGPAARAAVDSGADAVVFLGYYDQAGALAAALDQRGYTGLRVTTDAAMEPEFVTVGGRSTEGWYLVCPCSDPSDSPDGQEFARHYEEDNAQEPGMYSARAFDVATMIITAVATIGPTADRATVLDQLSAARFEGISGTIGFDENGEYTGTGPSLYRVENGEFAPLGVAEDYRT
jgi:branched-chain amino acid transport system substrate-binding protein